MKKFVATLMMTSFSFQHVAMAEISVRMVEQVSGTGTLSERAYLYRSTQAKREVSYSQRLSEDPQFFEKLPKQLEDFNKVYVKHLDFETDVMMMRDLNIGVVEAKKDLVDLVKQGVDTGLGAANKTPLTAVAMPMVNFLKDQAFGAVNKHYDEEIAKITTRSTQLAAWDFLRKVSKVANVDQLNFEDAQKLYKDTMGETSLLLDKGLRSKMSKLTTDKAALALYAGTQQFVMGAIKQFGSIKEAQTELNKKFDRFTLEQRELQVVEAREFLEGKTLMAQYQDSLLDETTRTKEILFIAQKSYMNSQSATGALLAQGVMSHAKLDEVLGNTSMLVAHAVKNMSANELLQHIKEPGSPREIRALANDQTKMAAIQLQAQKERLASIAQDIQTIGNAMVDAGLALGMDPEAARVMQGGIGILTGVIAFAAATGPVGYIVAVVSIICSVAGLFGRRGDDGQQQLMTFMQQLSKQVEEIKFQLFALKVIVTRQHAEVMQKLDMEFGKTKDGIEKLLKMEGLKEFETRYGSCLNLERFFGKWVQQSPQRFNITDDQYRLFFSSDAENGKLFKECLDAIDKIAAIDDVQSTSDYFYIYHFDGRENNPDVQFSRVDSYRRLWSYLQTIVKKLPTVANKLSPGQVDALSYRILTYVPRTHGWEAIKNRRLTNFRTDELGNSKELQVFQRGLISSSAVYYYVKTLGFLSQFAPYLDHRGNLVDLNERLKDTTPGQRYFPDSATGRIGDLISFVKPFLAGAIAQENLFSGAVVAEALAKEYVDLEVEARNVSQRHNSKENDVGTRFENQSMVSANATISQNFLANVVKFENKESMTSALQRFNTLLAEGELAKASALIPREMTLVSQDERFLNTIIGHRSGQVARLQQDVSLIKADPKGIGERVQELSRKETELRRVEAERDRLQADLKKLKLQSAYENKGKIFYFTLPISIQGEKQLAQIEVSDTPSNVIRFKKTERLEQLMGMREQLINLDFDYNWHNRTEGNAIREAEKAVEALQ